MVPGAERRRPDDYAAHDGGAVAFVAAGVMTTERTDIT